jgi:hypothetical protein
MHCKEVSIRDVSENLTEDGIAKLMDGWTSYIMTEYLVLRKKDDLAVIHLVEGPGTGLLRKLASYNIVSMPQDTVFVDDPDVDVLNMPAMARLQRKHPGKTVVISGMFSHVNIGSGIKPLKLRIIDDVPPLPSKLGILVRKALDSGYINLPILTEELDIDISSKVQGVRTEAVMFPCKVSGLKADIPYYFLDGTPHVDCSVTLIGCNLSKRIYDEVYGVDVPFIDVCPADNIIHDGVRTIVKCCRVKSGHEMDGNVALVPWGATVPEIVDAINDLFLE